MVAEVKIRRLGKVGAAVLSLGLLASSAMASMTSDFSANYNTSLDADAGSLPAATANGSPAYTLSSSVSKLGTGSLNASSTGSASIQYAGSNFPMTGSGTIEMWFNPNWSGSSTGENYLFYSYAPQDWSESTRIILYRANNSLIFGTYYDQDWTAQGVSTDISGWTAGQWHHIAATWFGCDGNGLSTLYLYVDGQLKATAGGWENRTVLQSVTEAYVGNNRNGTANADGYIDAVNYYSTAVYTGNTYTVPMTEVPEPVSLALLGLGGLAMLRRRK